MISALHLQNFKAFKDQRFGLAPLTLLAGLNGAGKSSLLQALLVLRQSFDQGLLSGNKVALNGDLTHLGRFEEVLCESADDEFIAIAIEENALRSRWALRFISREDRVGIVEELSPGPKTALASSLFNSGFRFLAAERIGPRTWYDVPDGGESAIGIGVRGEWSTHYLTGHGEEPIPNENCAHPTARSTQLAHQVEAWMGEVSPGIQLHFGSEPTLDLVRLAYSFVARRDTSRYYRPTNVGFGVSYTLPVVIAVLAARPGDLILLESPEAHLHPRGQAKLAELFCRAASAGVQIILESHSDHILNGVRVALHDDLISVEQTKLFYLRWGPDDSVGGTTVYDIAVDSNGRIDHWPEGFFDEFDRSLEILLTPKAIKR